MAMTIDLEMIRRPTELVLNGIEKALERTADPLNQAAFLPSNMKDGMLAG